MAKIEIWSKDVDNHTYERLNDPQHLYLIYTSDKGQKEIMRGGPEYDNPLGRDELLIIKQAYEKKSSSNKTPYDWNDGTHIGQVIASGNEREIAEKWNKMWQKAQEINQQKYDYEFLTQNSNTSALQLAKAVGIP